MPEGETGKPRAYRITYSRVLQFRITVDINREVLERLGLTEEDVRAYVENRREVILRAAAEAADQAAGEKIRELIEGYQNEFTP